MLNGSIDGVSKLDPLPLTTVALGYYRPIKL